MEIKTKDEGLCEEEWMEQGKYGYRVQISGWMRNLFVDLISKHQINSYGSAYGSES